MTRYDVTHTPTGFVHVVDDVRSTTAAVKQVSERLPVDPSELVAVKSENQEPTPEEAA